MKNKELFLFEVKMDTDGGPASFIHEAKLVKEKESWKIDWTPDFIFPGMKKIIKYVCKQNKENAGKYTIEMGKV